MIKTKCPKCNKTNITTDMCGGIVKYYCEDCDISWD